MTTSPWDGIRMYLDVAVTSPTSHLLWDPRQSRRSSQETLLSSLYQTLLFHNVVPSIISTVLFPSS